MNMLKTAAAALLLSLGAAAAHAQVKLAYCSPEYVLGLTPEAKQAETQLRTFAQKLEEQAQVKISYYRSKAEEYGAKESSMSPEQLEAARTELGKLEQEIRDLQQKGRDDLQKKQEELLSPVLTKIRTAIEDVAKDNGYTHVFSMSNGNGGSILLYAPPADDITEKVLNKLGIQMPKNQASGGAPAPGGAKPAGSPK